MRGSALWFLWMLMWILLAVNIPDWFPQWLQGLFWGAGVSSVIWGGAYAKHIDFMRDQIKGKDDDLKRKDKAIQDLKEKIAQPEISKPQSNEPRQKSRLPDPIESGRRHIPKMIFREGVYFSDKGEGPYCPICWTSRQTVLALKTRGLDKRWYCPTDDQYFSVK